MRRWPGVFQRCTPRFGSRMMRARACPGARAWTGLLIALGVAALVVPPGAPGIAGPAAPLHLIHVALTTGAANASVYAGTRSWPTRARW